MLASNGDNSSDFLAFKQRCVRSISLQPLLQFWFHFRFAQQRLAPSPPSLSACTSWTLLVHLTVWFDFMCIPFVHLLTCSSLFPRTTHIPRRRREVVLAVALVGKMSTFIDGDVAVFIERCQAEADELAGKIFLRTTYISILSGGVIWLILHTTIRDTSEYHDVVPYYFEWTSDYFLILWFSKVSLVIIRGMRNFTWSPSFPPFL